jgi:hypothetical protein
VSTILFSESVASGFEHSGSLFARANVKISRCADGESVAAAAAATKADVVFFAAADVEAARDLCARVRQARPSAKVAVVGSFGDGAEAARVAIRCDVVLAAPAEPSRVIATAAMLLGIAVREKVRILVRISTHVEFKGGGDVPAAFGTLVDLSESGVAVETDAELKNDQEVGLAFFLPGVSVRCQASATVVRFNPGAHCYGMRFKTFGGATQAAVAEFVERRARRRVER